MQIRVSYYSFVCINITIYINTENKKKQGNYQKKYLLLNNVTGQKTKKIRAIIQTTNYIGEYNILKINRG